MPPLPKKATTRSPSVTHDGVAQPFISWLFSGVPLHASWCHRIFPFFRSTHSTSRFCTLPSAEVRKMRSPQMIGDDCPLPGSAVFQTTDLASQRTGSPLSREWPSPCGPRHCGQLPSSPAIIDVVQPTEHARNRIVFTVDMALFQILVTWFHRGLRHINK